MSRYVWYLQLKPNFLFTMCDGGILFLSVEIICQGLISDFVEHRKECSWLRVLGLKEALNFFFFACFSSILPSIYIYSLGLQPLA